MTADAGLLLLCFGEGGHHAQARRLLPHLQLDANSTVLCLTDKQGIALPGTSELVFAPLRLKHAGVLRALIHLVVAVARNVRQLILLRRHIRANGRVVFVSLGPAFAVLPALLVKALGGEVVHIETWSRFTTYSVAGRLMYRVARIFLVQNEELLLLYPGAIFSGRL